MLFFSLRAAVAASWLRLSPVPSSPSCIIDSEGRDRLICSLFWLASHYRSRSELGAPPPFVVQRLNCFTRFFTRENRFLSFVKGKISSSVFFLISPQKKVCVVWGAGKKRGRGPSSEYGVGSTAWPEGEKMAS